MQDLLSPIFRSAIVSGLSASIAVAAAMLLVLCSIFAGSKFGRPILYASCAFLLVPTYAIAAAWSGSGGVQPWLAISPVATAQSPTYAMFVVAWITALARLPVAVLILILALARIPQASIHQATLVGGLRSVLTDLIWPRLLNAMALGWLACALITNADMVVSNLYMVESLTERAYLNISLDQKNALVTIASLLITLIPTILVFVSLAHTGQIHLRDHRGGHIWALTEPSAMIIGIARLTAVGLLILFVGISLVNLIYKSGYSVTAHNTQKISTSTESEKNVNSEVQAWFSLGKSLRSVIVAPYEFRNEWFWSIYLCMAATIAATVFSLVLYQAGKYCSGASVFINFTLIAMFALPGPIINQFALWLFNRPTTLASWLYNDTLIPAVFCLQFRLLPIAVLTTWPAINAINHRYGNLMQLDRSRALIGRLLQMRIYMLALSMTLLLCFALAMGELSCYLLVLPPGVTPLAMRIFDLLHYAVRFREAGLLVGLTTAGIAVSVLVLRRFVLS